MFKVRIRMEVLREAVEIISTLVAEVKLTVSKDGIDAKAVDPSHVAMLILKLKDTALELFTGETTEIGVDVEKIKEVLRLSRPGDIIELQYEGGKNRLVVSVGKITRHMGVVDPAGITDPKIPNVTPPGVAVVKMDELRQGIRGSESISDHVTLVLDATGFTMHSEGETDKVDLHIPAASLSRIEVKDAVRSMYPLDFFSNMVKSITSSEEVTLHLGNEYPLKIEFQLAGDRGEGRFLLAPRVEED